MFITGQITGDTSRHSMYFWVSYFSIFITIQKGIYGLWIYDQCYRQLNLDSVSLWIRHAFRKSENCVNGIWYVVQHKICLRRNNKWLNKKLSEMSISIKTIIPSKYTDKNGNIDGCLLVPGRQECRGRFPRHHGLMIPTCITARVSLVRGQYATDLTSTFHTGEDKATSMVKGVHGYLVKNKICSHVAM